MELLCRQTILGPCVAVTIVLGWWAISKSCRKLSHACLKIHFNNITSGLAKHLYTPLYISLPRISSAAVAAAAAEEQQQEQNSSSSKTAAAAAAAAGGGGGAAAIGGQHQAQQGCRNRSSKNSRRMRTSSRIGWFSWANLVGGCQVDGLEFWRSLPPHTNYDFVKSRHVLLYMGICWYQFSLNNIFWVEPIGILSWCDYAVTPSHRPPAKKR